MAGNRINWISGAKFISILAVVTVHCNGLMYTSNYIAMATSFSVTLFVMLSGIGTYLSYKRNPNISIKKNTLKCLPFIKAYIIATTILFFLYESDYTIAKFLKHILLFDIEGTYYFVFFFLQLKLLSVFLTKWYDICNKQKHKSFFHILSLAATLLVAFISMKFNIAPHLYGGGKYLFGGTYLFVFYLGIIIGPLAVHSLPFKKSVSTFITSSVCWFIWSIGIANHSIPFDKILSPFFGYGDNPPSVNYTVFALLTLMVCYSGFQIVEAIDFSLTNKIISFIVFLGNNTLEIFLYHFAIQKLTLVFIPAIASNKWVLRLVLFPTMIVLAPAIKMVIKSAISRIKYISDTKS